MNVRANGGAGGPPEVLSELARLRQQLANRDRVIHELGQALRERQRSASDGGDESDPSNEAVAEYALRIEHATAEVGDLRNQLSHGQEHLRREVEARDGEIARLQRRITELELVVNRKLIDRAWRLFQRVRQGRRDG